MKKYSKDLLNQRELFTDQHYQYRIGKEKTENMKFKKYIIPTALLQVISILILSFTFSSELISQINTGNKDLKVSRTEIYRGFNIGLGLSNEVLDTLLSITGAKVIRLSGPYMSKEAPYDFIESSFQTLTRTLDWAKKNNVRICIDPHTSPGMRDNWTGYPTDEFWKDKSWRQYLVKVWVRIINENKNRGREIYGYDLLNEPAIPDPGIYGNQWNEFIVTLVDTIRALGDKHTIIVEPTWIAYENGQHKDRVASFVDLILPKDDNLLVSPHVYEPFAFTHQGVYSNPVGIPYPGQIGKEFWDKDRLSAYLQPIRDFQKRYNGIPIFLAEFSASRAGGDASNVYLKDLIDLIEKEGWNWAYHSMRGGMWDPEQPVGSNRRQPRDKNTPRMKLLRSYYSNGTRPSILYEKK
jgi:endoglucanase